MTGSTISHYRILEKLGEGGMGVVYKAEDTRLHRTVALKFLRAESVEDEELTTRFRHEAEAAASLDHSNICTIHEIDEAEGQVFLAMAFVDGPSLKEAIAERPLKLDVALDLAIQIADGLAAAHEAGIVHRDIKPGNILMNRRRQVKILDFGLAHLGAATQITKTGTIIGTPAYMSPEQVRGEKTDTRTDIWSLGVVLYEMITGRLPFQGESGQAVALSIQNEQPEPPTALRSDIPKELDRIVSKALAKDPNGRYQHIEDLLVDLRWLKQDSGSGPGQPLPQSQGKRRTGLYVAAALLIVALVAWVANRYLLPAASDSAPQITRLTSYPGDESYPTFSPDGDEIAFSWNGPALDNYNIYRKLLGAGEEPLPLTSDPGVEYSPVWSPDGKRIALLRELKNGSSELVIVPALPGPERVLTEIRVRRSGIGPVQPPNHALAWTPDSKWLVAPASDTGVTLPGNSDQGLYLHPVDGGDEQRLTSGNDTGPAVSPDGRMLAFCRIRGYGLSELYVIRLSADLKPVGEPRQIGGDVRVAASPAWTADGDNIIFEGSSQGVRTLWVVPASGSREPERLAVGEEGSFPAVAHLGDRIAYSRRHEGRDIWRLELAGPDRKPQTPERFVPISSTQQEWWPRFSPDGRRIAFHSSRSGLHQVWTCNSDGSSLRQLTSVEQEMASSPRWSPDGSQIAYDSNTNEQSEVYVVSSEGGKPKRLAAGFVPSWSRDGRWVYFASDPGAGQVWKVSPNGGDPIPVTRDGGFVTQESLGGEWLYFLRAEGLWRMPVGGGDEFLLVESVFARNFVVVDRGIYFIAGSESDNHSLRFYDFETQGTRVVADLGQRVSAGLTVSPDERTFLFVRSALPEADIMLVENFR